MWKVYAVARGRVVRTYGASGEAAARALAEQKQAQYHQGETKYIPAQGPLDALRAAGEK